MLKKKQKHKNGSFLLNFYGNIEMWINSNKNEIFNGIVICLLGLLTEAGLWGRGRVVPLQSWQGLRT